MGPSVPWFYIQYLETKLNDQFILILFNIKFNMFITGYFRISPYRGVEEREWIANKLNITSKQVTVWFQVITQHK